MTTNITEAWTSYSFRPGDIEELKDEFETSIPYGWERQDDVHLTLLPHFEFPARYKRDVKRMLSHAASPAVEMTLDIEGVRCYNTLDSEKRTFVLCLNISDEHYSALEDIRDYQSSIVQDIGGRIRQPPVEPHITLFKARPWYEDDVPPAEAEKLRSAMRDIEAPSQISVLSHFTEER